VECLIGQASEQKHQIPLAQGILDIGVDPPVIEANGLVEEGLVSQFRRLEVEKK